MTTNTDIISREIVDAAYHLHKDLGPGMLESVYEGLLEELLRRRGLRVQRQVRITFVYEGIRLDRAFRVDLLVNKSVVIEVKARERVHPAHRRQLFTYLRVLGLEVGLLLNFGGSTMKEGIRRVVNGYKPTAQTGLRIEQLPAPSPIPDLVRF